MYLHTYYIYSRKYHALFIKFSDSNQLRKSMLQVQNVLYYVRTLETLEATNLQSTDI